MFIRVIAGIIVPILCRSFTIIRRKRGISLDKRLSGGVDWDPGAVARLGGGAVVGSASTRTCVQNTHIRIRAILAGKTRDRIYIWIQRRRRLTFVWSNED